MKRIIVPNIIAIISIIFTLLLDYWYYQNNLKFISEPTKEQIVNWLELDKAYTNSLELISEHQIPDGYRELIFKISKEEYEKNKLNYSEYFYSPEMTLKARKEYDNNNYICIIKMHKFEKEYEYNTLGTITRNVDMLGTISSIIKFLIISLILIFIGYLNIVNIENNKIEHRRNMIIISILVTIIAFSLIMYSILNDEKDSLSEYNENSTNLKDQSQSTTEATQIATETIDIEMRKRELDEKMKSIMYGILNCVGEFETQYNEEEVNNTINQIVIKNGIYISEKGREKILNLINNTTNSEYKINNDGYLIINDNSNNEISQKLNALISGDKCIILDYNIYYYCILGNDICTFNIEETQYLEKFENENLIIMVLNPKKYEEEYESNKDLINQIINNAM